MNEHVDGETAWTPGLHGRLSSFQLELRNLKTSKRGNKALSIPRKGRNNKACDVWEFSVPNR